MNALQTRLQNPFGLHQRYVVRKIELIPNPDFSATAKASQVIDNKSQYLQVTAPVNNNADYFVLRLDEMQSDPNHLMACRIAINAYANAINNSLPKLAADLIARYPLV